MPSVGAALGLDKDKLDYMGRWKIGGEGERPWSQALRDTRRVVRCASAQG